MRGFGAITKPSSPVIRSAVSGRISKTGWQRHPSIRSSNRLALLNRLLLKRSSNATWEVGRFADATGKLYKPAEILVPAPQRTGYRPSIFTAAYQEDDPRFPSKEESFV